jgi:hypothetical protein
MPTWLVEDPTFVYFLLALAGLGLAYGWWVTRRGKYLLGVGGVIGLIVLIMLLDRWVVTDQEQIVEKIQLMADGVAARDMGRTFAHVSDRFRLGGRTGAMDKQAFRRWAEDAIRHHRVTSLRVWGFTHGLADRDKRAATIEFLVKGHGDWGRGGEFYRCKASFRLDPDGEWRLSGFELFQPHLDPNVADPIPLPFVGQ